MAMIITKRLALLSCVCMLLICNYSGYIKENAHVSEMPYPKQQRENFTPLHSKHKRPDGRCDGCFNWKANRTISPRSTFCQNGVKRIDLLIIYTMSARSVKRRELLRKMHTEDLDTKERIRVVFAFGQLKGSDQKIIEQEAKEYGDILEFDCEDSYYRMFPMHVNSLHWVHSKCTNVRFTVKMVDDAFLNIKGVLTLLDKYGQTELKDVVFGKCLAGERPIRFPHKWQVSVKKYPFPRYPTICGGGGIFMSFETGMALLNQTADMRYVLDLDDTDIGINALLAKRCLCNIPGFHLGYKGSKKILNKLSPELPVDCKRFPLKLFLGLHMFNTKDDSWMKYVWEHRKCYADSIPQNVVCPKWGNCPDKTYPLPRG